MDGIDKFKSSEKDLINVEIEQKMGEIRTLLEDMGIKFTSFSLRLLVWNREKTTLEQVENILSVVENMVSFRNTMGMDEFGEPVSILDGYGETKKLTELEKINGILDRAGKPE